MVMKIRNGFVSNSSSSSFILAFPNEPCSVNEIKELVFGGENYEFNCKTGRGKFEANTDQISGIIYGEILKGDYGCKSLTSVVDLIDHLKFVYGKEFVCYRDSEFCGKYFDQKKGECKFRCPKFETCSDNSHLSYDETKRREKRNEIESTLVVYERVVEFVESTLGYKYYWLDCGYQTTFGAFLNENHEKIFKNIRYIYVDKEC